MFPAKLTDQVFVPPRGFPQTTRYVGGIRLEHVQDFNVDDAIEQWCGIEIKLLCFQSVFDQKNFKLPDATTKAGEQF
jgi:hypothetical protein